MESLNSIGRAVREWQDRNFDGVSMLTQGLVLGEECGEVQRAIVKTHHGVRAQSRGDLAEELGDVLMCALSIADRAGIDIDGALHERFHRLMTLDFRADPEAGQTPRPKCLRCGDSGIVAGPNEYETAKCPECPDA